MGRKGSSVEIRDSSMRVQFMLDGEIIRERLTLNGKSMPPTPANVKYATRLVAEIKRRVALGIFRFDEFFPDSPRAKVEDPQSFGTLADLWLESKGTHAAGTVYHYGVSVRKWKEILGTTTPISKITHQVLSAKIGGYPWSSPKYANNCLVALRGIMAMEYSGRRAADNPMAGIRNLKVVKKYPDPFTKKERDLILSHMLANYDIRVWAYFSFQFFTGARPEETIALRWGDVDWHTKQIRIRRVRTFRGNERNGTKTHTERDIDLTAPALAALTSMKPYTFMKQGSVDPDADIFENPVTVKPWHDERAQRRSYFAPTLKQLGIRHRPPYNARHTFATVALMAQVNPTYIARQLGHASTKMLFEKYARWIDGADDGVERRALEAAMSGEFIPNSSQKQIGST